MLPASMVFLHSCFLCWGALTSNPDVSCNKYANDNDVSRIVIGILISALMLSWTRCVCACAPLSSAAALQAPYDSWQCLRSLIEVHLHLRSGSLLAHHWGLLPAQCHPGS
jgi:hypothetical protein